MPARPRQGRRVQRREYDALHIVQLESGHRWFSNTGFVDDEDLQAGWEQLRDSVLAWHIAACPGSRPWAWWHIEAPGPRQLLIGTPHTCPARQRHQQGLYFGMPHVYGCPRCWEERHESQARFLIRWKLLLPAEEAVIPRDLARCDAWFAHRYGGVDENPTPAGGMGAFQRLLAP